VDRRRKSKHERPTGARLTVNIGTLLVPEPGDLGGVNRPLKRDPLLAKTCTQCGRLRQIVRKPSFILGCHVITLRCASQMGDVPKLEHDPPERFTERNKKVRPLTESEADKLRGRNKTAFSMPTCELVGCARLGKRMEISTHLSRTIASGGVQKLAMYACRPSRPATAHYEYRVLPRGEVARPVIDEKTRKVVEGRYRWTDAQTGEQRETLRKQRAIRADRIMPEKECPLHKCTLKQGRGPFQRLGKGKWWQATCVVAGERYNVFNDGSVRKFSDSRWRKPKEKISARTIEKGQLCNQIEGEMRKIKTLGAASGRTVVEIQLAHPDFAVWKVRDTLSEEDRELFNHPRQWGPVIGYAELVLGRHYGKSAQTVQGWVKDYRAASRKQAS
jgi:hypothetical protein